MIEGIVTRPATKADAAEIALLVNIAVHGGIAQGWAHDDAAEGTYDPIEIGRLEMMDDDTEFGWKNVTMAATVEGEIAGMLLGYRKADTFEAVPAEVTGFMRPILQLEAEAYRTWFISMLGVHLKWRGRGVGSQLLEVAEVKRDETKAHGLSLIVEDENEGARRLYEGRGFSVRTKRPMGRYPGGGPDGRDWLLMVKD